MKFERVAFVLMFLLTIATFVFSLLIWLNLPKQVVVAEKVEAQPDLISPVPVATIEPTVEVATPTAEVKKAKPTVEVTIEDKAE